MLFLLLSSTIQLSEHLSINLIAPRCGFLGKFGFRVLLRVALPQKTLESRVASNIKCSERECESQRP